MSNETDLDWLARNVHKWLGNADFLRIDGGAADFVFCGRIGEDYKKDNWLTRDQWLSRRAELQNKPSWCLSGGWSKYLAQDMDGEWKWLGENPSLGDDHWTADELRYQCKGVVIGDWRDTLEKRPEEFQPFISIEDNQGQEMNHDKGWFERGELPPVGVVCEAYIDHPPQWVEAEIVAHKDGFAIGWCKSVMKGCHGDKASEFRPIRTERDELMDVIVSQGFLSKDGGVCGQIADAILAAGFSLGAK